MTWRKITITQVHKYMSVHQLSHQDQSNSILIKVIIKRHFDHASAQGDPSGWGRWQLDQGELHQDTQVIRLLHEGFRQEQGWDCHGGECDVLFEFRSNLLSELTSISFTMCQITLSAPK